MFDVVFSALDLLKEPDNGHYCAIHLGFERMDERGMKKMKEKEFNVYGVFESSRGSLDISSTVSAVNEYEAVKVYTHSLHELLDVEFDEVRVTCVMETEANRVELT